MQNILLLVDDETIDEIVQSEKVSDVVEEIQKVIAKGQKQARDTESDYSQKSGRESKKPCPSRPASLEKQVKSPEKRSTSSCSSSTPVLERMEEEMSGKSEDRFSEDIPSEKSEEQTSEKLEEKLSEVSVSSQTAAEYLAMCLIARLMAQYKKSLKKPLLSLANKNLEDIIEHVKNLVQPEISIEESITNLDKNVSQLTKKLFKGLIKEFGSTEQVMNAAWAGDSSFDEAILKHLKINLGVLTSPPQKSKIARFFGAVGRAIMYPFRCCFKGSDD